MPLPSFGMEGLLAFWNSMTDEQRNALIEKLETFHASVSSLKMRGIIETSKSLSEIVIIKKCKETNELKKLLKSLKLPGIKIIDPPKKDTP